MKDPLVHFLVIGGLLFAGLTLMSGDSSEPGERIVISAAQVAEISRAAELLQGRPPTEAELRGSVEQVVRDEVYYRNALRLGLDVDDTVVRQRLIEKMRELAENVVNPLPPDADLRAWFLDNAERFRIPELVSFDHVFFSPSERGETVVGDANAALAALGRGEAQSQFGDSTPLNNRFETADEGRVRVLFGDALTDAVFESELDRWIGPFESDFGWHVVRVTSRTAARDPSFDEVEDRVRDAYAGEQLAAANAEAFAEMLAGFDVQIQWEPDSEPVSWQ